MLRKTNKRRFKKGHTLGCQIRSGGVGKNRKINKRENLDLQAVLLQK